MLILVRRLVQQLVDNFALLMYRALDLSSRHPHTVPSHLYCTHTVPSHLYCTHTVPSHLYCTHTVPSHLYCTHRTIPSLLSQIVPCLLSPCRTNPCVNLSPHPHYQLLRNLYCPHTVPSLLSTCHAIPTVHTHRTIPPTVNML
jgi:hypothetical protein